MFRIAGVLVVGLAVAGCQTQASGWEKPGMAQAQVDKDFKECTYEAEKASQPSAIRDPLASGVSDGMRFNKIRSMCLEVRGYSQKG